MRSNFSLQPSSNPPPPLGHHHVNCCLHLKESCVDAESNIPPSAQATSTAPGLGPASVQPAASTVVSVGYGGTTCVNVLHTNPMNQDQNNLSTTKAVVHQWQVNWKRLWQRAGQQHNKCEDYIWYITCAVWVKIENVAFILHKRILDCQWEDTNRLCHFNQESCTRWHLANHLALELHRRQLVMIAILTCAPYWHLSFYKHLVTPAWSCSRFCSRMKVFNLCVCFSNCL